MKKLDFEKLQGRLQKLYIERNPKTLKRLREAEKPIFLEELERPFKSLKLDESEILGDLDNSFPPIYNNEE